MGSVPPEAGGRRQLLESLPAAEAAHPGPARRFSPQCPLRFPRRIDYKVPNPWLLLESKHEDGAVPAVADANSMTYVLHLKLGEIRAGGASVSALWRRFGTACFRANC